MENMKWNEKFKTFCFANGWTQQEVAEMVGAGIVTVRHWYQGTRPISDNFRKVLVEKLGLDLKLLEDGEIDIYSIFTKDMKWHNKLKAYCHAKGWTFDQVAEMTGYSPLTISCWFRGDRRPSDKSKLVLVEKLGVDISIFYEEFE